MSIEPDYTDAEGRPITQEQHERRAMVDEARRVGEAQQRSRRVMEEVRSAPDLAAMVPPAFRHDPMSYINQMSAKGSDTVAPRVLDSSKVGDYVLDPNILRSCTTPGGFECPASALKPDGLVNYMGMTIKAAQAVEMGVLEMDERGVFRIPDAAARKAETQAEDAAAKAEREAELVALREAGSEPDSRTQGAIDLVVKHVPEQARTALIHDFVSQGDLSMAAVNEVGRQLGWTESQAQGAAYVVVKGLQDQASRAAISAGVPAHEVADLWHFLSERYPVEQKHAALALINMSDASPIRALAKKFLGQKPRQ